MIHLGTDLSENLHWGMSFLPSLGCPRAPPSTLPLRTLRAVPLDSHTGDGQLRKDEELLHSVSKNHCLGYTAVMLHVKLVPTMPTERAGK